MKTLVIYGAAYLDVVKLVAAVNRAAPTWELRGFLDDTRDKQGRRFHGVPVLGGRERLPDLAGDGAHVFNNVCGHWTRSRLIAERLDQAGLPAATLVHPAVDMEYVRAGRGLYLPEGCVVGGNTVLGDFVTVRLGTVISHDVTVEDHVFIGPGVTIGSGVVLARGCFIGAGSTVMLDRRVGAGALVGAGSLVTRDVEPETVVAGAPARSRGPRRKEAP